MAVFCYEKSRKVLLKKQDDNWRNKDTRGFLDVVHNLKYNKLENRVILFDSKPLSTNFGQSIFKEHANLNMQRTVSCLPHIWLWPCDIKCSCLQL